jgi:hypothetical protein
MFSILFFFFVGIVHNVHWNCVLYYVFVDILLTMLYFLQAICSYSGQGSFGLSFNSHSFLFDGSHIFYFIFFLVANFYFVVHR